MKSRGCVADAILVRSGCRNAQNIAFFGTPFWNHFRSKIPKNVEKIIPARDPKQTGTSINQAREIGHKRDQRPGGQRGTTGDNGGQRTPHPQKIAAGQN